MKRLRRAIATPVAYVAVIALAAFAFALASPAPPLHAQLARLQSFDTSSLSILTRSGKTHAFKVEIARTPSQHAQGLMFRRTLAADAGMLFIYDRENRVRMWMKNTYIPLDMLFIASDGTIVDMAMRTVPMSLETVASNQPVRAVLELNAGTVSRLGLAPGDRVDHPAFAAGSN